MPHSQTPILSICTCLSTRGLPVRNTRVGRAPRSERGVTRARPSVKVKIEACSNAMRDLALPPMPLLMSAPLLMLYAVLLVLYAIHLLSSRCGTGWNKTKEAPINRRLDEEFGLLTMPSPQASPGPSPGRPRRSSLSIGRLALGRYRSNLDETTICDSVSVVPHPASPSLMVALDGLVSLSRARSTRTSVGPAHETQGAKPLDDVAMRVTRMTTSMTIPTAMPMIMTMGVFRLVITCPIVPAWEAMSPGRGHGLLR